MSRSLNGQSAHTRPNILLIVMDAARAKNLSCYGYLRPTTPHLDRFAEQCVVYEQAIATAGWSLPSHASIFTGLYPSRHGAHDQHKFLSPDHPTMAELLRARGYRTLAFCQNQYVGSATDLDRGFEWFNRDAGRAPRPVRRIVKWIGDGLAHMLDQQDSGAWLIHRQIAAALRAGRTDPRPFFIFINYLEPHMPYRSPRSFARHLPSGVTRRQSKQVNVDPWKYMLRPDLMNERDFEIVRGLHDNALSYVDARIAELIGWLKQSSILDRTLVLILSDHGENFGEHGLMGHGYCLYDTILHIPLIVHYPKGTARPGRVSHQVQTVDLLPTILAMLGDISSETYRSLQGHDLLSSARHPFTIAEQANPDPRPFNKRFPGADISRFDRALYMLRTDHHKYIWDSKGQHELYDLASDPAEERNIVGERGDIAADLDRQLAGWRNSFQAAAPADGAPEFDEEVVERLRALGYLE